MPESIANIHFIFFTFFDIERLKPLSLRPAENGKNAAAASVMMMRRSNEQNEKKKWTTLNDQGQQRCRHAVPDHIRNL